MRLWLFVLVGTVGGSCTVGTITCYEDNVDGVRIMGDPVEEDDVKMTLEHCSQLCAWRNAVMAGVENANQCMCGTNVVTGAKASDSCNLPCSGNSSEICGGSGALGIFKVDCTVNFIASSWTDLVVAINAIGSRSGVVSLANGFKCDYDTARGGGNYCCGRRDVTRQQCDLRRGWSRAVLLGGQWCEVLAGRDYTEEFGQR
jgi:hypothetical protein